MNTSFLKPFLSLFVLVCLLSFFASCGKEHDLISEVVVRDAKASYAQKQKFLGNDLEDKVVTTEDTESSAAQLP